VYEMRERERVRERERDKQTDRQRQTEQCIERRREQYSGIGRAKYR
jgi:hypothetical protein